MVSLPTCKCLRISSCVSPFLDSSSASRFCKSSVIVSNLFSSAESFMLSFNLFKVSEDSRNAVHVDTHDFAYLVLTQAGEPKLHDHQITQKIFGGLRFFLLTLCHNSLLASFPDPREFFVYVGVGSAKHASNLGGLKPEVRQNFYALSKCERLLALSSKK